MNTTRQSVLRLLFAQTSQDSDCVPRSPSIYAYEIESLASRLRWDRHKTAADFLEKHDEAFFRALRGFKETSAAAPLHPHKPQLDAPYFVKTATLDDLDILMPYSDGTIRYSQVVHVGPKGSGKTTIQNQWLHNRHADLESKRVFYVRCDAPKLFEFWERQYSSPATWPPSSLPTVEEYLDFQTLYILAKYPNSGLPGEIVKRLEDEQVEFDFKEDRAVDSPLRTRRSVAWYLREHIAKNIAVFEAGDPGRSYLVGALFEDKPTKRREFFRWEECANAVRSWMRERGYISLRILDGVDNLHLNTEAGKGIYWKFLPQITKFVLRACPRGEIHFAVMRNRTWIDVQAKDPVTQGSPLVTTPKVIEHVPPWSTDVLQGRIKWLRRSPDNEEVARVIEATTRIIPDGATLHHNMRTVIVGASSLAEQVRFRCHQLGLGHVDVENQSKVQMTRNLFLNGRLFLETQRSYATMNREKGLPYLNPFWFPDDFVLKDGAQDPIFLRIRILEILEHSDMLEATLRTTLTRDFGYDDHAVDLAIDDARAFGWIDTKSELQGSSHLTFELNAMGKYLLHELLTDVNCLYVLALDTRLPKTFFDRDLIQVHTNHLGERTGYVGAAAVTLVTFLNWLNCLNTRELSRLPTARLKSSFRPSFLSPIAMRRIARRFSRMLALAGTEDWALLTAKYRFSPDGDAGSLEGISSP